VSLRLISVSIGSLFFCVDSISAHQLCSFPFPCFSILSSSHSFLFFSTFSLFFLIPSSLLECSLLPQIPDDFCQKQALSVRSPESKGKILCVLLAEVSIDPSLFQVPNQSSVITTQPPNLITINRFCGSIQSRYIGQVLH
jgi:hypothetical protein